MSSHRGRNWQSRSHDYLYDPVYTVCSEKDHFQAAAAAARHKCLFKTCLNFPSMFSDSPLYPKNILKIRPDPPLAIDSSYSARIRAMSEPQRPLHVVGQDRYLFFRRPIVPFLAPVTPSTQIPVNINCPNLKEVMCAAQDRCHGLPYRMEESKETQTDYRESETQTSPWQPPYRVPPGQHPEVLTLAHLTWGHGLPAGMHEVEIINRMRMKRAWEAILPPMDSPANIKTRIAIIAAIEADDWAFREAEIQFILDMRMQLMEELTRARDEEDAAKKEARFHRLEEFLEKRRANEVRNIRHKLGRELRKLAVKHRTRKDIWFKKYDIIRNHADPKSELYGPQLRFGENPQRRHENLCKKLLKENYIDDAEKEETLPDWLPTYEQLKAIRPKPKPSELCIRETRWTEEKLKRLHADLKAIRLKLQPPTTISLMERKYKAPPLPSTPVVIGLQNVEEQLDQSAIFIQQIIRGRAIQCVMFEGRDRCRELIEELQSTHALQEHTRKLRELQKRHVIGLRREQNFRNLQENRLAEILDSLEGMTVSGMLDFLSKELVRLQDERRTHAFAMLAERKRNMREAEEAGRRQLEEHRRRECDEMFRQMVKVNQDTVDVYLEDIIKESIDWVSEKQATEYIRDLADRVDRASEYANDNASDLLEEEMVSDMIYNFVLPEVDKQIVRNRMRVRQQSYLRNAHAAIYDEILNLPGEERQLPLEEIYVAEEGDEEEMEAREFYEPSEEPRRETSEDWIRRRIVGEIVDPARTITGSIMDLIVCRVIPTEAEQIVADLLDNIISAAVPEEPVTQVRPMTPPVIGSSSEGK